MRLMQVRCLPGELVRNRVLRNVLLLLTEVSMFAPIPVPTGHSFPRHTLAIGCGDSPKSEFGERCATIGLPACRVSRLPACSLF
jgi:hypothetical protein